MESHQNQLIGGWSDLNREKEEAKEVVDSQKVLQKERVTGKALLA